MDFYATFLRRIPQRNTVRFRGDSEPMTCWSCAHCFVRRTPRRYGFYLQEVADATGINFVHQAPTLDHKLDHIIRRVASMGTGRFYRRFDRDGWQDIYRALLELSWEDVDFDQNCQWGEPQVIQELLCHTDLRITNRHLRPSCDERQAEGSEQSCKKCFSQVSRGRCFS